MPPIARLELEGTDCPLCASERSAETPYGQEGFAVVRCRDCDVHYLSPRLPEPDMMAWYREGAYFAGEAVGYSAYEEQGETLRRTFRRVLSHLADRGLTGGSLLEVGCGYGYFLEAARDRFDRRVGTEMSEEAAILAGDRADVVHIGGVEAVPVDERFDLIAAIHVLEHVYRPHTFLRDLVQRLRSGGRLFVATPDMGSWWRKLLGARWPSFKYPEHVVFYDRASLRSLLGQVDEVSGVTEIPYPHAFPLSVVAEKLGLPVPARLRATCVWIPATTIAFVGSTAAAPAVEPGAARGGA